MRILFLVLVLGNLAFAAWHAWFSAPEVPTRPIRSDAPTIELIAEAGTSAAPEEVAAAQSAVAERTPPDLRDCVSIGPFPNRIDVSDAAAAITAAGFATSQRVAEGDVWLGYWVYLDAIPTQNEAADIVDRLAEEGITEAYVIADGDNGNIVSLGVFSQRARSQQRFADVEAMGFAPVIASRSQPGDVFWLDVTAPGGRDFDVAELPEIRIDPEPQLAGCAERTQ